MLVILLFAKLLLPSYGSVPIILDRAEQSSNYWSDQNFASNAIDGKQTFLQMNNKKSCLLKERRYILKYSVSI